MGIRIVVLVGGVLLLIALATGLTLRARGAQSAAAQTVSTVQPTINVSGEGRVSARPDMATINLGVQARGRSVAEALDLANQSLDQVRGSLRANGIDDRDIQTSSISISPQYGSRPSSDGPPPIVGYQASQQLQVRVRDISKAGKVIDDAAAAGGDQFVMNGLRFTVADPTALQSQAREQAYAKARAKAEELARLGGLTLGAPIAMNEGAQPPPPVLGGRGGDVAVPAAAPAVTSVSTGELEVVVTLQVNFAAR
jgi:hypothetical protein